MCGAGCGPRRQDAPTKEDLPCRHGIKPEEVEIEVDEGVLTVVGKHEEATEETGERYVRRERRYGAFSRRLPLPEGVDRMRTGRPPP